MASQENVKQYLAYWFQLGKKVVFGNGQEVLLPKSIIEGDRYSKEFESCWQRILASRVTCYLEGTEQTIEQLLSPMWDIDPCARCGMPVPAIELGIQPNSCPCNDLPNWPNTQLPSPRAPIDSSARLNRIKERLNRAREQW
ncbi:MAG: hypothetical protein MUD14_12630 [Hydrococcus sp. Prado102]|nr:hypothetical protein [Hydrococcus sp. Prado102]